MVLLTKRRAHAQRSDARAEERAASGVAAAASAAAAAKANAGERRRGGMHTILDSIVVKRGATGGQVQVHRRCRYACSMPSAAHALWRERRIRFARLLFVPGLAVSPFFAFRASSCFHFLSNSVISRPEIKRPSEVKAFGWIFFVALYFLDDRR